MRHYSHRQSFIFIGGEALAPSPAGFSTDRPAGRDKHGVAGSWHRSVETARKCENTYKPVKPLAKVVPFLTE
jgi:hypothetical protein